MHALQILQRPSRHATLAHCHPIPPNPSVVLLRQVIVAAACKSFLPRRLNYSEIGKNESNFKSFNTARLSHRVAVCVRVPGTRTLAPANPAPRHSSRTTTWE